LRILEQGCRQKFSKGKDRKFAKNTGKSYSYARRLFGISLITLSMDRQQKNELKEIFENQEKVLDVLKNKVN
jgi:hypothetical protein